MFLTSVSPSVTPPGPYTLGMGGIPTSVASAYRIDLSKKIPPLSEDNYLDWLFSISTCFAAMGLSKLLTVRHHEGAPASTAAHEAQSGRANRAPVRSREVHPVDGRSSDQGSSDPASRVDGNRPSGQFQNAGFSAGDYEDSDDEDVL